MKMQNEDINIKIESLRPFLNRSDLIGYAAARNTRRLIDASAEYMERRDNLIHKYGTEELDNDGNPTGRVGILIDSDSFKNFKKEIEQFAIIEHDVTIMTIPYSEVVGKLTGSEILEIDWMLEDSDSPAEG